MAITIIGDWVFKKFLYFAIYFAVGGFHSKSKRITGK